VRFAQVGLVLAVGCSHTRPPVATVLSCPSVIGGSVHDLDDHDAALADATVAISHGTALTDNAGSFLIEDVAQPPGDIRVYFADITATGHATSCVDRQVWIGVHTRTASTAAVIRMEDRSVDLAAVQRADQRRDALAERWLTFYEAFSRVVDGSRADCDHMATALEQFVARHRDAIDDIQHARAAMSDDESAQLKETMERRFASRGATARRATDGVHACDGDPRVRRALRDIPR
jgi:hypothetical protein